MAWLEHPRGGISKALYELIDAGLLQTDKHDLGTAKFSVTEYLLKLQSLMGFSLNFLASFDRDRCMTLEPLFGLPRMVGPWSKPDVFVLMPFKDDMKPIYEDHITPTCSSLGLFVRRADDFFTANLVVSDVWNAIAGARLIVADCTDRNPNVFYEIGLAHTIGQPTILLTQREEDIPFDLRHLRYIAYQLPPRGMKEFETKFKETLRTSSSRGGSNNPSRLKVKLANAPRVHLYPGAITPAACASRG